jgi:hypothetical protein
MTLILLLFLLPWLIVLAGFYIAAARWWGKEFSAAKERREHKKGKPSLRSLRSFAANPPPPIPVSPSLNPQL